MSYASCVADQIGRVRDFGKNVVLVSSGADALGGQEPLTKAWEQAFATCGVASTQILFREESFQSHTQDVRTALQNGVIPVINGDNGLYLGERTTNNDILASHIARDHHAPALLLTSVDGVLDAKGEVIPYLSSAHPIVDFGKTAHGTGGIHAKVEAARFVAQSGQIAHIANGRRENVILDFAFGRNGFGTRIAA